MFGQRGTLVSVPAAGATIEESRRLILDELGDPADLTVLGGVGNRGDELIYAGVRELLADRIYAEVDLPRLTAASGDTVLISGGGAFCRPYHELMPRALAVAGMRFKRVIVLPSSFDPSEDEVREALMRSGATVFARERQSYQRIVSLCDARLAHDCAFFFDFTPYRGAGAGTLNAFRTDREALPGRRPPSDNDDISVTAPTLQDWLERIAAHDTIRTDRAHVMIAAALLGKRVEFASSAYHKLDAIAEYALQEHAVTRLADVSPLVPGRVAARPGRRRPTTPRVTAIVLTRDRPALAMGAVDSLQSNEVSLETLIVDNNSAPAAAAALAAGAADRDSVVLRRSDRNLGCAGGRQQAASAAGGEFVLFLDDDAELRPGAVDLLVADLDAHPEAGAVTATVVMADGTFHHSGGWLRVSGGVADFSLIGTGQPITDQLPATGPAGWVPGTAALIRRQVLDQCPIDERMTGYFEDNEWCYRVERVQPGRMRRSLEARAVHHFTPKFGPGIDFTSRSVAVELLRAHARFYERHGVLLGPSLFDLVPELRDASGAPDVIAARLLMELLLAKGTDWTFSEWMNGNLEGLLGGRARRAAQACRLAERDRTIAERDRIIAERDRIIAEQADLVEFLYERHLTLERLLDGGWWKLRLRLLPLLGLYWRLRGRGRGHAAGREGGTR